MEEYKYLFKVVLIGNAGVGKTCLVRRFTQGLFPPGQGATIGVDFMIKSVEIDNEKVKLQIWDTAGQERFRSITQSYYRSANALILVYDVSCQPTFDCLQTWLQEIDQYANSKVFTYLVGNKSDKVNQREIPLYVGEEFAQRHEMKFIETSAKEAENVERLFMDIAKELIRQTKANEIQPHFEEEINTAGSTPVQDKKLDSKPIYVNKIQNHYLQFLKAKIQSSEDGHETFLRLSSDDLDAAVPGRSGGRLPGYWLEIGRGEGSSQRAFAIHMFKKTKKEEKFGDDWS